jgi:arsenite methyltransferase
MQRDPIEEGMWPEPGELREQVRRVYSQLAAAPDAHHPFRVGRQLAERAGYSEAWLSGIPTASIESFAGVSCVPCFAEVSSEARVLDLGCGAGLDALLVAPRANSTVGLDFSRQMLVRARRSAETMGITNVEFHEGDAEQIPAAPASFDVALVNGIFNLNPARNDIFRELARVVRPGGLVFAAELVLKGPLPPDVQPSAEDWFA